MVGNKKTSRSEEVCRRGHKGVSLEVCLPGGLPGEDGGRADRLVRTHQKMIETNLRPAMLNYTDFFSKKSAKKSLSWSRDSSYGALEFGRSSLPLDS